MNVLLDVDLPASPGAAREARSLMRDLGRRLDASSDVLDAVLLMVSEVVTNAVVHGRSDPRLVVVQEGSVLEVRVRDDNTHLPTVRPVDPKALGGRGLSIVDLVSDDWGYRPHPGGKEVWFRVVLT